MAWGGEQANVARRQKSIELDSAHPRVVWKGGIQAAISKTGSGKRGCLPR